MEDSSVQWKILGAALVGVAVGVAASKVVSSRRSDTKSLAVNLSNDNNDVLQVVESEQLSRNEALYGREGLERIRKSFVIVVGLGGVGSHAAMSLVRSGVGRIRLIDYDQVTVSSLNRHACATRADVGVGKCEVLRRFFSHVMPSTVVEVVKVVFKGESAPVLLAGKPDFVVDAIDNRETKAELIEYCLKNDIAIISSMGAGARIDPTRVHISNLTQTRTDPLCKSMRFVLRKMHVNTDAVPVVYSSEVPAAKLMDLNGEIAENPEEYQMLPNFRVRIMPVVGTVPAVFGLVAATYVLNSLSGKDVSSMLPSKMPVSHIQKMLQSLYQSEERHYKASRDVRSLTLDDATLAVMDMFDSRCVATNVVEDLHLRRWRRDEPASLNNIVLLSSAKAKAHDAGKPLAEIYTPEVIAKVDRILQRTSEILKSVKEPSINNNNIE